MKSLSSNLLKGFWISVDESETRVINSNALVEKRLMEENGDYPEGFQGGLSAETYDEQDYGEDTGESGNVLKAEPREPVYEGPSPEELIEAAQAEIAEMKAAAMAEIDRMRKESATAGRLEGLENGRREGYAEGSSKAQEELQAEKQQLEAEYQQKLEMLEPDLVSKISGIYEHIFHVDLEAFRDVVLSLLIDCIQKTDASRNYIVHVSSDDYPYVSMQKSKIQDEMGSKTAQLDIVEDVTLSKNQCMIETDGGIFDCSLDVQLTALRKQLKLISYEEEDQD